MEPTTPGADQEVIRRTSKLHRHVFTHLHTVDKLEQGSNNGSICPTKLRNLLGLGIVIRSTLHICVCIIIPTCTQPSRFYSSVRYVIMYLEVLS